MDEPLEVDAEVLAALPLSRFQIRLSDGEELIAILSRRLAHRHSAPALPSGTRVVVERSRDDTTMCRIIRLARAERGAAADRGRGSE